MGNCLRCRERNARTEREDESSVTDNRRSRLGGYFEGDPILHLTPGISRPMSQLTEEEQVKIATRMGLIATLPLVKFDEDKREKWSECIICMCEYEVGEELRYLPCLHTYHRVCIDDWLMRSLTCPSCLDELQPASPRTNRSLESTRRSELRNSRQSTGNESIGTCTTELLGCATTTSQTTVTSSRKRGDSASQMDTQPDSSVSRSVVKSMTSADQSLKNKNDNNRSDRGDVLNVAAATSSSHSHSGLRRHRRTRSNGFAGSRTEVPFHQERFRRLNSATDVYLVHASAIHDSIQVTEPSSGQRRFPVTPYFSTPHQTDGDSHQTHFG